MDEFMVGVRKTTHQPEELLRWCVEGTVNRQRAFYKLGLRKADPTVSAWQSVAWDEAVCTQRIALGALAPKPLRAVEAEAVLVGNHLRAEAIAEVAHLAAEAARPISDIRGSAAYRKRVTEITVRRLLTQIAENI
jgi:carbon-monoxide dehydrogenase medium subunit